jgi:hypothetical protein
MGIFFVVHFFFFLHEVLIFFWVICSWSFPFCCSKSHFFVPHVLMHFLLLFVLGLVNLTIILGKSHGQRKKLSS